MSRIEFQNNKSQEIKVFTDPISVTVHGAGKSTVYTDFIKVAYDNNPDNTFEIVTRPDGGALVLGKEWSVIKTKV